METVLGMSVEYFEVTVFVNSYTTAVVYTFQTTHFVIKSNNVFINTFKTNTKRINNISIYAIRGKKVFTIE